MQPIDESRLESDLPYRYQYLSEFIGFGPDDVRRIHAVAPHLGPSVAALVETTYRKLLSYDATARHFVQHQAGGPAGATGSLAELTDQHANIRFRKEHLVRYLMQILGRAYDDRMVQYLDMVGKIHTSAAGNAEIVVPLVQMNALMGHLSDVVSDAVTRLPIPPHELVPTLRAFQKLFWIQNDLISRHYAR
jgi:hypothetical protein